MRSDRFLVQKCELDDTWEAIMPPASASLAAAQGSSQQHPPTHQPQNYQHQHQHPPQPPPPPQQHHYQQNRHHKGGGGGSSSKCKSKGAGRSSSYSSSSASDNRKLSRQAGFQLQLALQPEGPLPHGWVKKHTKDKRRKPYFVDTVNRETTWLDPRTNRPADPFGVLGQVRRDAFLQSSIHRLLHSLLCTALNAHSSIQHSSFVRCTSLLPFYE